MCIPIPVFPMAYTYVELIKYIIIITNNEITVRTLFKPLSKSLFNIYELSNIHEQVYNYIINCINIICIHYLLIKLACLFYT